MASDTTKGPSGVAEAEAFAADLDVGARNPTNWQASLIAGVALLWAIQIVNWIIGYGLNPAFGLIPKGKGDPQQPRVVRVWLTEHQADRNFLGRHCLHGGRFTGGLYGC